MTKPEDSVLIVRRSILIKAPPGRVWHQFATFDKMERWWGARMGAPEAGTSQGQWLIAYEPRVGGRIEMAVLWDDAKVHYGGAITEFAPGRALTFECDWIPNRGWVAPTYVTVRLTPALGGTLAEVFHYGFERTGGDVASEHEGYEHGWGMTQLSALKRIVEAA
jgi:uncharacterized protein YndB with AHSA1/START domain